MILKDLKEEWHVGSNYAILSLPIVTYSVQPHWRNNFETIESRLRYVVSYKSNIALSQSIEEEYESIEDAKKGCEKHLQRLLEYLFLKLDKIVALTNNESLLSITYPSNYMEVSHYR
jgi:hypothetical protein